ncbi:hypothetical protein ACJRO7_034515 [Eucalyptus globulus]|uniref:Uncharacterized protein n=2 Tax=Eucalyptus globulus TaxID=34317 RepID=A0ABD3J3M3_EUCGL
MAQDKVLIAVVFFLLAFSLKLQSTQARQLRLTMQKQNSFSNKLQNVNELVEKEPRKTIAEQSKYLHGETWNEATNTVASSTPPPPSPLHSLDDFRPTAPGHSPGVGHSLQN